MAEVEEVRSIAATAYGGFMRTCLRIRWVAKLVVSNQPKTKLVRLEKIWNLTSRPK